MLHHTEYPQVRVNNQNVYLLPGSRFGKRELEDRLSLMGVQSSIKDKKSMINLYESALSDSSNLKKIFDKVRADTEEINRKFNGERKTASFANNDVGRGIEKKVINIKSNIEPFNDREQQVNVSKAYNSNNYRLSQNPFISESQGQYQDMPTVENIVSGGGRGYSYNNINNQNNNNFINTNVNNNRNTVKTFNNDDDDDEDNNYYNNRNNNKNTRIIQTINLRPGGNKNPNYTNNNNNTNINENRNVNNNYINKDQYNIRERPQEEEHYLSNSRKISLNRNINTNSNVNNNNYRNTVGVSDSRKYTNNPNNYEMSQNQNQRRNTFDNQKFYEEDNFQPPLGNTRQNINQFVNNPPQEQRGILVSGENDEHIGGRGDGDGNNNPPQDGNNDQEFDRESNYTSLSGIKSFYNNKIYKNRREIGNGLLIALIAAFIIVSIVYILHNYGSQLGEYSNNFFENITSPTAVIRGIFGFITSIFFNTFRYWYITIPLLLILCAIIYFLHKKKFENKCKDIMKAIIKDLMETEPDEQGFRKISENDLITKYSKMFNINEKRFRKKYWPELKKMRRDEKSLKTLTIKDEQSGQDILCWFLTNH